MVTPPNSAALGGGVPFLTYPHPSCGLWETLSIIWSLEGTWGVQAGEILLRASLEGDITSKDTRTVPHHIRLLHILRGKSTQWGQVFDRSCSKVSSGHFLQGPGPNRHLSPGNSSKPAGQLFRRPSPSKTLVVVSWGMGLQDALRILLH